MVARSILRHPNVLPLLGVTITENRLVMVSDWMEDGNVDDFMKAHTDINRLKLVSLSFKLHLDLFLTVS